MPAVTLPRGAITTSLVATLDALALPVGDCDAPLAPHGWQGEPNASGSNFIPWVVLAPSTASNSSGSIGASQSEWRAIYFITIAGVTRKQTESVADKTRIVLSSAAQTKVTATTLTTGADEVWSIQQVRVTSIGAVARNHGVSPPYYVQTDTVEVWLSKEL